MTHNDSRDIVSDMSYNIKTFFAAATLYIATFNAWCVKTLPDAQADHLCYKCGSTQEFEQLRAMFEQESAFIYQSVISQRRIAIVAFREPIGTALGDIRFLELSDQKPDSSQDSGFDHIEIYPNSGTMDALADTLESKGTTFTKIERPHHTTYDAVIDGKSFKVRLEPEALLAKIKKEEMR